MRWTKEQDEYLKNNYNVISKHIIAEKLGVTVNSVRRRHYMLEHEGAPYEREKPVIHKHCPVCGGDFTASLSFQRFCSIECQKINTALDRKSKAKEEQETPTEKKKKGKSLAELAREANEHNMTYGQYISMIEKRTVGMY